MAWLTKRGNVFHLGFRYSGRVFRTSLKTTDRRTANAAVSRIDENIRRMESGRLTLPDDTSDLATFLLSDRKLTAWPEQPSVTTLCDLFEGYLVAVSNGSMEANSLSTIGIHMNHLKAALEDGGFAFVGAGRRSLIRTVSDDRGQRRQIRTAFAGKIGENGLQSQFELLRADVPQR